jgi:hypothetical protein
LDGKFRVERGSKLSKSIKSLSVLGKKTGPDVVPGFLDQVLQDLEGLLVVGACEGRFHRTAVVDDYVAVPIDPL